MKKKLAIVISLLLIFSALPLVLGINLKKHYDIALKELANSTNMNFKIIAYQRHWFYSDAILLTNLPLIDKPLAENPLPSDTSLVIQQRLYHGPIIINRNGLKVALIDILSDYRGTLLADTKLTLTKHLITQIKLPSLVIRNATLQPIYTLLGAYGDIDWNIPKGQLKGNIKIHQLVANDLKRTIDRFNVHYQLIKTKDGLWVGDKRYHFDQIAWQQCSDHFVLKDFNYALASTVHNEHYNNNISCQIKNLWCNQRDFGNQQIQLSVQDLSQKGVETFFKEFPLTEAHLLKPYQFKQAQQQFMTLLSQGGQLKIDNLHFTTTSGPINITASFNAKPSHAQITANIPTEVMNKVLYGFYQLKLRTADEQLIQKEVEQLLSTWQKGNWLTISGSQTLINYKWH